MGPQMRQVQLGENWAAVPECRQLNGMSLLCGTEKNSISVKIQGERKRAGDGKERKRAFVVEELVEPIFVRFPSTFLICKLVAVADLLHCCRADIGGYSGVEGGGSLQQGPLVRSIGRKWLASGFYRDVALRRSNCGLSLSLSLSCALLIRPSIDQT